MQNRTHRKVKKINKNLLEEMRLQDLRQIREINQEKLAKRLKTKQANVSRLENREDMLVSTLRSYVEAIGGELLIIAKFSEDEFCINQFSGNILKRKRK